MQGIRKKTPFILGGGPQYGEVFPMEFEGAVGESSITAPVYRANLVPFTIRSGSAPERSFDDALFINRHAVASAGAFIIPALPVAVVYDPPQTEGAVNKVLYARTNRLSVSTGFSMASGTSETTPTATHDYTDVTSFQQTMGTMATGFRVLSGKFPKAAIAAGAFQAMSDASVA